MGNETGQYSNPYRIFKKNSQIGLLKLNLVPLGAGQVPDKTYPITIPSCKSEF